jgi:hypothetical protein
MLKTMLNKLAKAGITYYGYTEIANDGTKTKMDCRYTNGQWVIRRAPKQD